jgi:hypothetical protein
MAKPGLYANIHAKRKRIAAGSKEKMRRPGTKGAPTAKQFKQAAKTAKKPKTVRKMFAGGVILILVWLLLWHNKLVHRIM